MITLSEFPAHLNTITRETWQPLIDLIPEIEQTTVFGEEGEFRLTEDGIKIIPYWEPAGVVIRFT